METIFLCYDTTCVPERKLFVLFGQVIEGALSKGMDLQLPQAPLSSYVIYCVEMLRGRLGDTQPSVAIGIHYETEAELQLLKGLPLENVSLKAIQNSQN